MFTEKLDRANATFKEMLMDIYNGQPNSFKQEVTSEEYYNSFGVVEVNGKLEYAGYNEFDISEELQKKISDAFREIEKHYRLDPLQ